MSFRDIVRKLEARFDARRYLERFERKEHGARWSLTCPECEKDDKLWVVVGDDIAAKDGSARPPGTWICFYCDEFGGALDLIRLLEDKSLFSALEVLREFSGEPERTGDIAAMVERIFAEVPEAEPIKEEPCFLPEGFTAAKLDYRFPIPTYFSERGIGRVDAVRRGLGWCSHGKYVNRLVVPVMRGGELQWFQARWMKKTPPEGVKKYLNSSAGHASLDLYGVDLWRRCRRVILVEDVFSSIWVGRGALGTFGTHFSQAQLALLAETEAEEIVIMWDPDALDKAYDLAKTLSEIWTVRVIHLPIGKDPDDIPQSAGQALIEETVPLDYRTTFSKSIRARLSQI